MVFLLCLFGFMVVQILYKWVTPMNDPPSIINAMIAMSMFREDHHPMFGTWYRTLMVITMATVPILIVPKPATLYLQFKWRTRRRQRPRLSLRYMYDEEQFGEEEEEEVFDWMDVVVHQLIEAIEFVLGTVSHTASYLRLWALSLAHQQLATVFFQKTIASTMCFPFPYNAITTYFVGFPVWLSTTVVILVGMDVMECFLHTLRLHWVEFQSKFYKGDGWAFAPYRHHVILTSA